MSDKAWYEFSDGTTLYTTDDEAANYQSQTNTIIIRYRKVISHTSDPPGYRPAKTYRVAFQPQWHPGLGMHVETKRQYEAELKKRGLVEAGNDYVAPTFTPTNKPYINEDVAQELRECDVPGTVIEPLMKEASDAK